MTQKDKKQESAGDGIDLKQAEELIERLNKMIDQFGMEAKIFKKDYIQSLEARESSVAERESTITAREESVKTRLAEAVAKETDAGSRLVEIEAMEKAFEKISAGLEKQANDVAAKKAEIFSAAESLAAQLHDKRIQETEEEAQRIRDAAFEEAQKIRDAALTDAQKTRNAAETAAQSTRDDAQKNVESALAAVEKQVKEILDGAKANAKLLVDEATSQAKQAIADAEKKAKGIQEKAARDTNVLDEQIKGLIQEKTKLENENRKYFAENAQIHIENSNLETECKKQKEDFDNKTALYEKTLADFKTLRTQLENSGKDVSQFSEEISKLATREQELNNKDGELRDLARKLDFKERRNDRKDTSLKELQETIEKEIEDRYGEVLKTKDDRIAVLEGEVRDLQNNRNDITNLLTKFEDLKRDLGEDPIAMKAKIEKLRTEWSLAMDEVHNTPSYVIQKKAKDLEEFKRQLDEREKILNDKIGENEELRSKSTLMQDTINTLQTDYDNVNKQNKMLSEKLGRLVKTYEEPEERDNRIEAINKPVVVKKDDMVRSEKEFSEIEWLNGIGRKIDDFGLHFPRRILHAFHTALKTSEMAPITVLAGVSGTGKSELPRLYSYFGGINFLPVPVQPNWDSQESMLGYYNSIDNCFEPQNILRLLAQSQRKADDQDGLDDVMTMILLDEMNLANIELYFAEFLSKLETRRGLDDSHVPNLPVKIGSKMMDWELPLGRNVLWTGTMNNDETTKALSDKVLDRGIVINFPRPETLFRSKNNTLQGKAPLLLRKNWDEWKRNAYKFKPEEIEPYMKKVDEINAYLGTTGRAVGHRVWQSIESYMSMYPDVIRAKDDDAKRKNAMDMAFEDQIVQKVMPKLRGLEVRGDQGDALVKIGGIIPEALRADFENAKQGYGQFIWTTSGYLLKGDEAPQDEVQTEQQPEQQPEGEAEEKMGKDRGKKK